MMQRSFVRLVVRSVLIFWLIGSVAGLMYGLTRTWTQDHARSSGVFFIYKTLEAEPVGLRAARLLELQQHFAVPYTLLTPHEASQHVGRPLAPGERAYHKELPRKQWYFIMFSDGSEVLAAGPVNPMWPHGWIPFGAIIAIIVVPLLAALWAFRVERELAKVERASKALATGNLNARVDNKQGPSHELAASFNDMAERIKQLIQSREELVQAVSHELGSPLTRLRLHVGLLEDDLGDEHRTRLDGMSTELDELDELVKELLHYIRSDEELPRLKTFRPMSLLEDLAELTSLDSSLDDDMEVVLEGTFGGDMYADPRLFQRAVENVLRNAVRHAHSKVWLVVEDEGTHVKVAVHDDGPGISEDMYEKVWIPFVRLEADRDRDKGGVGLGLAIVARILKRHNGHTTISRSPHGGALVISHWPKMRP